MTTINAISIIGPIIILIHYNFLIHFDPKLSYRNPPELELEPYRLNLTDLPLFESREPPSFPAKYI